MHKKTCKHLVCDGYKHSNIVCKTCLNSERELVILNDWGNEFHNFGAEYENERSYRTDLDQGIDKRPLSDDLSDSELVSDIGFNKLVIYVIYAGVIPFNALNVKLCCTSSA